MTAGTVWLCLATFWLALTFMALLASHETGPTTITRRVLGIGATFFFAVVVLALILLT